MPGTFRQLALAVLLVIGGGCTYEPTYQVTCSEEGATEDGKRCDDGVWIRVDAGPVTPDGGEACTETAEEMCERLELNCGEVTAEDACGEMRTVECGSCSAPAECGADGTPNVCGCPGQSDAEFCASHGKNCGMLTARDECGLMRTAPCGDCGDLASCLDNVCTCDMTTACERLEVDCGDVAVANRCAGQESISCGTCSENATCVERSCVCDAGFDPVPSGCQDIDECANAALHDCDPNAECTNVPGGYECDCLPGWVGDGTSCRIPTLVSSVQTVTVTLPDGTESAMGTLTNAVDMDQTVLFASQRNNDVAEADRLSVEVRMSAVNQVEVIRPDAKNEMTVVVYAVEFDPLVASVQSDAFLFSDESESVAFAGSVDPTRAFVVFNYSVDDNTHDRNDLLVSGTITNGGDTLALKRNSNKGTVSGTYWVVEAVDDAFSVQHFVESIPDDSGGNTTIIDPVTMDSTMLLYSYGSDLNSGAPDRSQVRCELDETTEVYCRRSDNEDAITDLALQVVSFDGDPSVQRAVEQIVADQDGITRTLNTPVDPTRAMAFGGQLGLIGVTQLETGDHNNSSAGFFTEELVDGGASLKLTRGAPLYVRAHHSWQVVEW